MPKGMYDRSVAVRTSPPVAVDDEGRMKRLRQMRDAGTLLAVLTDQDRDPEGHGLGSPRRHAMDVLLLLAEIDLGPIDHHQYR